MTFTFDTFIERYNGELAVTVSYTVSPFYPATRTQPAEGGEIEIISAEFADSDAANMPAPITEAEHDALRIQCQQRAQSDIDDAKAAAAEYRAETRRDFA